MRKIKFRAWDNESEEIIYDPTIWTDHFARDINQYFEYWQEIVSEDERMIFMQYTGLKDKNNKEIYEGDIVKITIPPYDENEGEFTIIAPIIYREDIASFDIDWKSIDQEKFDELYSRSGHFRIFVYTGSNILSCFELEVIGNIYENQETAKKIGIYF